ncbi:MAG: hypothetical protein ACK5PW_20095 [Burkholderiales bacterium]|jgi:hypothetical protein
MGTAASVTTNPIRRLAPQAFSLARGACGTMSAMRGAGADAAASGDRTGDGFYHVWSIA